MNITVNSSQPERKLKAVVLTKGVYVFYRGKVYRHTLEEYPTQDHQATNFDTLEYLIKRRPSAKPVYEGDTVTLQFLERI